MVRHRVHPPGQFEQTGIGEAPSGQFQKCRVQAGHRQHGPCHDEHLVHHLGHGLDPVPRTGQEGAQPGQSRCGRICRIGERAQVLGEYVPDEIRLEPGLRRGHLELQPPVADRVCGEEHVAIVRDRVAGIAGRGELVQRDGALEGRRHRVRHQHLCRFVVESVDDEEVVGVHVPVRGPEGQMEVVRGDRDRVPGGQLGPDLQPALIGVGRPVPSRPDPVVGRQTAEQRVGVSRQVVLLPPQITGVVKTPGGSEYSHRVHAPLSQQHPCGGVQAVPEFVPPVLDGLQFNAHDEPPDPSLR
ncbi:hypothetical protein OG883_12795 [Streptomyces sp. NBC_01142]|nr:hypothetical protein [Streptomyces sp. NBC_01142]MCX4820771.1 hypothetical protein [Streptomyces sp. NBC_01142]